MALTYRSHLKSGEVLLVHGAAGGVGLTAVELGKAMGATVIATAGTDEKVDLAKSYGADYGINYSNEDIREKVLEYTGGADVIYDPVGGDAFKGVSSLYQFRGPDHYHRLCQRRDSADSDELSTGKVFTVDGFVWGAYHRNKVDVIHEGYAGLREIWAKGALKPHISHRFPLAEAGEVDARIVGAEIDRKVVVEVRKPAVESASIVTWPGWFATRSNHAFSAGRFERSYPPSCATWV